MGSPKGPRGEPGGPARRAHQGVDRVPVRQRLHPFRLLVMLERHDYSWLHRDGLKVTAFTHGLVRLLKVSRYRLDDYFYWLERFGYLKDVKRQRGRVEAELIPPKLYL